MKSLLFILISIITIGNMSAQTAAFSTYLHHGCYIFDGTQKVMQSDLFTTDKSEFSLASNDSMAFSEMHYDSSGGGFHAKYRQYYKGYEVENHFMNVNGFYGVVLCVNGIIRTGLSVSVTSPISESVALDSALNYIGASSYIWNDDSAQLELKQDLQDSNATYYPKGQLVITRHKDTSDIAANYVLCWRFSISPMDSDMNPSLIYVNALTGHIFDQYSTLADDYHSNDDVCTLNNGTRSINTETCSLCFTHWLFSSKNIHTHYYKYHNNKKTVKEVRDNDDNWCESDVKEPASVHWAAEQAFEYYLVCHGRSSPDYYGIMLNIYTNDKISGPFSGHNPGDVDDQIYFPAAISGHNSFAALDIVAHEYTHLLIDHTCYLHYGDDAQALNEGFADIFGYLIERHFLGVSDWTVGEDQGDVVRHLDDPSADWDHLSSPNTTGSPDIYTSNGSWRTTDSHRNSGILRKWFYLLANGGTFNGKTVQGVGIETADDIAYITFNWWLWGSANYVDAAYQSAYAAIYTYGSCSDEHKQVVKAWQAVGINLPTPSCIIHVDGQRVIPNDTHPNQVYHALLQSDVSSGGTYSWSLPSGWSYTHAGDSIVITTVGDFNSHEISCTYTDTHRHSFSDGLVVHFSSDTAGYPRLHAPKDGGNQNSQPINDFKLYPNPSNGAFTMALDYPLSNGTLSIIDLLGRTIYQRSISAQLNFLDISDLPKGLYLLQVKGDQFFGTKKIELVH